MKKIVALLFVALLVIAGCSNKNETTDANSNLFTGEVTLPATMFQGKDIDEVTAQAKEKGVEEVIKNDDGSITYKMSKANHKKFITKMKEDITSSIKEIKSSGTFVSIKDITYNDDLSEFTMLVDKEKFEGSFDSMASMGLGLQGVYYQLFQGKNIDDTKVTIIIKDTDNEEIINTIIYPEDIKNKE